MISQDADLHAASPLALQSTKTLITPKPSAIDGDLSRWLESHDI